MYTYVTHSYTQFKYIAPLSKSFKVPKSFHLKALFTFTNYMIFVKLTNDKEHSRSKQTDKINKINSLISENFTLEVVFESYAVMRMSRKWSKV